MPRRALPVLASLAISTILYSATYNDALGTGERIEYLPWFLVAAFAAGFVVARPWIVGAIGGPAIAALIAEIASLERTAGVTDTAWLFFVSPEIEVVCLLFALAFGIGLRIVIADPRRTT